MRKPSGQIGDRLMRLLTTFALLTICLTAIGQTFPTKKESWGRVDTLFTKKSKSQKTLTFYPGTYIDTEAKYTDSTGIVVIVQNSLPKGGGYTDLTGKPHGYRIFWTRVINETASPIELSINFPADSLADLPLTDSYFKVFLPPDTMTLDKEMLYSYGAIGLKSFLDTGLTEPTTLQRTINPKEACLFYVGVLFIGEGDGKSVVGRLHAGLVLKEQGLVYRMSDTEIPCGQIVFKK